MKALIIIDVENEWFMEDSEYYVGEHETELKNMNNLVDVCRVKKYKIIFIRHVDPKDAFVEGTQGAELVAELHRDKKDLVITKHRVSPFYATPLEKEIKGATEVVVCGMLTNMCVRSAVADAYDRDFSITLIEDACIAMDKKTHEFTIHDLKTTRPEVKVCTTKEFIA